MTMAVICALVDSIQSPVHHSISRFVLLYSFIVYAFLLPYSLWADSYEICKNDQKCGNISVLYPFGVGDRGCGLPDFQVDCEKVRPVIEIDSQNYTILSVFPNNSTCLITSDKIFEDCDFSDVLLNASQLVNSVFDYIIDTRNIPRRVFRCDQQCGLEGIYPAGIPTCSLETVTVQEWMIHWNTSVDHIERLYRSCYNCENSRGLCGYNTSNSQQFLCYCENGIYGNQCPNEGKRSLNLGAVIGGSLGGVGLLIAAIFVICKSSQRRRSHPHGTILMANEVSYTEKGDIEAGVQGKIGTLPIFSYEILKQATDSFAEEKMLGDGGFGAVYLGKLPDGRAVAVKRMYQDNWRRADQFINEVEILSSLHHPNLVRLYGCTSPESRDLLLVYEYVQNGTVADHLHGEKKGNGLKWETRLKICLETAQALAFLHEQDPPVLHRDVKTTNILVDEYFKVKVADFGLSRYMPPDVTHVSTAPQGTPGYLDPEYYECFQLTEKSDVYSFGVVLVELISSKLAVDVNRSRKEIALSNMALTKIREGTLQELVDSSLGFDFDDEVRESVTAVAELAFRCLQASKDDRPDMMEIVVQLEQIEQNWEHVQNPDSHSFRSEGGKKGYSRMAPPSPTSVQDKWSSTQTTPNNSA